MDLFFFALPVTLVGIAYLLPSLTPMREPERRSREVMAPGQKSFCNAC